MKNLNFLKEWQIAHRGLHNNNNKIPENSIIAYKEAINKNYAIELDITFLTDGSIVCFHDDNLLRMTGVDLEIKTCNLNTVKDLKLLNTDEIIPLFEDLLRLVDGKVPLLIEIKQNRNFKTFFKNLTTLLDNYDGEFAIFSFNPLVLSILKKYRKNYIRGQITSYFNELSTMSKPLKYLMKSLFFNHFTKPDFISYNIDNLPNKYADKAKKKGLTVISYTAKNQNDYDLALKHYDNIVFEGFIPLKK
ncbi:glycerophosphodiester phosphodiesterase family protein [Haploplasma axanthum]|uniref:Membrane domain of membrane-anchored glycerophosphoryl diester phosphodiesterase n=1 Tax=Haploplasma axanthum TaxID=29552 RepID=A0A449BCW7_HAPAX|nr:glycerophosphodiester phosphodiesterase family protein [Haploplasma axanthum]VEU80268.1 Membrane domain of membrane-anchored glycerophosphoryl diester phosphodiesterase [Haploplasma axanthum]